MGEAEALVPGTHSDETKRVTGTNSEVGPLEAQVLRTVAELPPPVTVREVCDALGREGYFAYQGVLNCMNRLAKKGILTRRRQGNAFVFRAAVDLEELTAQVVSNILSHMSRQPDRVICRLLDIDPDIGETEIEELRQRVRAMGQKRKG
jgi:predicted transcriptional regulator